jgi:hypothetical protein
MAAGDGWPGLPPFQLEVAQLFFALPASMGFLLAGGAALLAQHLTARPTEDLDFFTAPDRWHVPAARDALEAEARQRGWGTERIRRFGKDVLLALAAQIDAGFDVRVLADMIATLDRFTDSDIPVPDGSSAAGLRQFYGTWRSELTA